MAEEVSGKAPLNANERGDLRVMLSRWRHRQWLVGQLLKYGKYIAATVAFVVTVQKLDLLRPFRSFLGWLTGSGG